MNLIIQEHCRGHEVMHHTIEAMQDSRRSAPVTLLYPWEVKVPSSPFCQQ